MRKFNLVLAVIVTLSCFVSSCLKQPQNCKTYEQCYQGINNNLKNTNIEGAVKYYNRYVELNGEENMALLYKIAYSTAREIYEGHIDFGGHIQALVIANEVYSKSGVPFIGEKIGTKNVANEVENKKLSAKLITASFLPPDEKDSYISNILYVFDDPDPFNRGLGAACLTLHMDKRFIPVLEKIVEKDKTEFVKQYALRGLAQVKFDAYKDEIINMYNTNNTFAKCIASGALLYNDDNRGIEVLKEGINSKEQILVLRSLEALILKKNIPDEKTVIKLVDSNYFLKSLNASLLLAAVNKPEYISLLKEKLKQKNYQNKLTVSIGLLSADDFSGIRYIKKALYSKNFVERIFASRSIIKYCNRHNMCK